jgi:prepilin-type N-terminal cleavage/methylation domain-containing protein
MTRPPHRSSWPTRRNRAFTLVEIAVVILVIGLLTAMTLPAYRKITLKSKATAVTKDLRTFSDAFVSNNLQNSKWATDVGTPGQVPPELANSLPAAFTKPTPIGGKYIWISNSTYKAALGVTTDGASTLTDDVEQLEVVDLMLDDGDIGNTASSVHMAGPMIVYVLER